MAEWNIQSFSLAHTISQSLNDAERNAQNCCINFYHAAKITTDSTANRYASACVSVPIHATNVHIKQVHVDANYSVCIVITGQELVLVVPSGDYEMIKLTCNVQLGLSDRALASTISKDNFINSCFAFIPVITNHMILDKRIFDIDLNYQTRSQNVYLNAFIDASIDYYGHPVATFVSNFDSCYSSGNVFVNMILR